MCLVCLFRCVEGCLLVSVVQGSQESVSIKGEDLFLLNYTFIQNVPVSTPPSIQIRTLCLWNQSVCSEPFVTDPWRRHRVHLPLFTHFRDLDGQSFCASLIFIFFCARQETPVNSAVHFPYSCVASPDTTGYGHGIPWLQPLLAHCSFCVHSLLCSSLPSTHVHLVFSLGFHILYCPSPSLLATLSSWTHEQHWYS